MVRNGMGWDEMGYLERFGVNLFLLRDSRVRRNVLRLELAYVRGAESEEIVHFL